MYVWENPFGDLISRVRGREIGKVKKTQLIKGLNFGFFFFASSLVAFLTLVPFALGGNTLSAHRVFTSIALFDTLRLTMALFFPLAIQYFSEMRVSCDRIEQFLRLPERGRPRVRSNSDLANDKSPVSTATILEMKDKDRNSISNVGANTSNDLPLEVGSIKLQDACLSWSDDDQLVLNRISAVVLPGQLVGIVGPVGSGKSTLLLSLLRSDLI